MHGNLSGQNLPKFLFVKVFIPKEFEINVESQNVFSFLFLNNHANEIFMFFTRSSLVSGGFKLEIGCLPLVFLVDSWHRNWF